MRTPDSTIGYRTRIARVSHAYPVQHGRHIGRYPVRPVGRITQRTLGAHMRMRDARLWHGMASRYIR
jgi:hypothetical protein